MSINHSILNSVGLKDPNIKFIISSDDSFNEVVPYGKDQHQAVLYRATLSTCPEHCPQCGFTLENHVYLAGTDSAEYKLPTTNGYQQILHLTKQRFQCRYCHSTFVAQSTDFMSHSTISRPLLHQAIDLAKRDISEKNIAHILHLSPSKVNKLLHNAAKKYRTNYNKQLPTIVCVDEVKYAKHQYGFEMVNGTTSDLIEIFPTRTNVDIQRYLSQYDLANRKQVQYVVTDMNANYETPLRLMFPNAEIIIDRFHIIQLAMKAVQSTRINLQRTIDNKKSRVYKLLKSNWQFFITDRSKINFAKVHWFKGINEYLYPQDALQLIFGLSPKFKQAYDVYQAILTAEKSQSFEQFESIISNYHVTHSAMDQVITTYRKHLKGIRNAFLSTPSNGRIEGMNRRIKQIGRTAYGYANSLNYFFRIRLQLFNRHQLNDQFISLLVTKNTPI